jgi:hypothetical protein
VDGSLRDLHSTSTRPQKDSSSDALEQAVNAAAEAQKAAAVAAQAVTNATTALKALVRASSNNKHAYAGQLNSFTLL